jgi:hypothetical protein
MHEAAKLLRQAGMDVEAAEVEFLARQHYRRCRALERRKSAADYVWCVKEACLEYASGYGVRWWRWAGVAAVLVIAFALAYMPRPSVAEGLRFWPTVELQDYVPPVV